MGVEPTFGMVEVEVGMEVEKVLAVEQKHTAAVAVCTVAEQEDRTVLPQQTAAVDSPW